MLSAGKVVSFKILLLKGGMSRVKKMQLQLYVQIQEWSSLVSTRSDRTIAAAILDRNEFTWKGKGERSISFF